MDYFKNIDWSSVWGILKDTIIPHSGTLIFNIILFLFIGFLLSIIYAIFLSKQRVLKRKPKYYNWVVKLYIPILIVSFLSIFGQIGFLRGVHKILSKEKDPIVTSIYFKTLGLVFECEESKDAFVKEIQIAGIDVKDNSDSLIKQLNKTAQNYNTGISLIDDRKNEIAIYLIEKKANEIYKICTHEMYKLAGANVNVDSDEPLSYSKLSESLNSLLHMNYKEIELALKDKLTIWFVALLDSQFDLMVKSLLIVLVLIMSIPVIEFFIYKKFIEPKLIKNELDK